MSKPREDWKIKLQSTLWTIDKYVSLFQMFVSIGLVFERGERLVIYTGKIKCH